MRIGFLLVCLVFFGFSGKLHSSERLMSIILNAPSDHFVVQLASYPENVDFDKALRELEYSKQLVAIKTKVEGTNRWVLLEGIYANKDEAEARGQRIEKDYPRIQPWPRSINSLRSVLAIRSLKIQKKRQ